MTHSIFLFTEYFHPAYKAGGPIQSCVNLIKLLDNHYQFAVFTRNHDLGDSHPFQQINSGQWNAFTDNAEVFYAGPNDAKLKKIKEQIKRVDPDIIYINGIYSLPFNIIPLYIARYLGISVIIAPRGMLQQGALSVKPFKKQAFLFLFKLFRLHKKVTWHATDQQEIQDIRQIMGAGCKVKLAENVPTLNLIQSVNTVKKEPDALNLVFVSLITAKKNLVFILELISQFPEKQISLDIYGPVKDHAYWKICLQYIETLPNVRHQGDLPHYKVQDTIQNYHIFILPTKGENFGHAIFEAMQVGRPVLISDQTPWQNLETSQAGWAIPLNQPEQWQQSLKKLIQMDQEEYNTWCFNSKNVADQYLDQANFEEQYRELFEI